MIIAQQRLIYNPPRLEKIPYTFHYQFACDDPRCRGHDLSIIDWEIAQVFRSWRRKYSEQTALEKIWEKWLTQMFGSSRESYLIVRTHYRYKTHLVLGVFWPPKG